MTTTHTPNYAAVAAHTTIDELSLVITLNYDMITDHIHGTIELADAELHTASLIHQAATDELHTRAILFDTDRDQYLTRSGERHLGLIALGWANGRYDTLTPTMRPIASRRAILNELHTRALTIHISRTHLTTTRAAARHLATLIRQHRMDGQDVHDMGHDEYSGLTVVDRHGYPEVYAFLLTACDTFNVDGYGLLQTATVDILGW